jgi:succinyl-diaminopimelate desuccinylase
MPVTDPAEVLALTRRLISFPSVNPPGDVRDITDYIEERCTAWGLAPERLAASPDRPNLRMRVGGGSGPTLVLYGHTDVVPVGGLERERWRSDPFEGTVRGDRLYGRGAVDSKGTLAGMLIAARELAKRQEQMNGTVVFWVVADGEVGDRAGLKWLGEQGLLGGDMVIGCEPSQMRLIRAYKGRAWIELAVRGRMGHSLRPNAHDNAIMAMVDVLRALRDDYPLVPPGVPASSPEILGGASLTCTRVRAGEALNVSPGECAATIDVRMMPGDSSHAALARLNELLARLDLGDWTVTAEVVPGSLREPVVLADDAAIVRVMRRAMAAAGLEPAAGPGFSSGGVGNFLQMGIPGVYYGPGTIEDAHGANESVAVEDLGRAAEVYCQAGLAATGAGGDGQARVAS